MFPLATPPSARLAHRRGQALGPLANIGEQQATSNPVMRRGQPLNALRLGRRARMAATQDRAVAVHIVAPPSEAVPLDNHNPSRSTSLNAMDSTLDDASPHIPARHPGRPAHSRPSLPRNLWILERSNSDNSSEELSPRAPPPAAITSTDSNRTPTITPSNVSGVNIISPWFSQDVMSNDELESPDVESYDPHLPAPYASPAHLAHSAIPKITRVLGAPHPDVLFVHTPPMAQKVTASIGPNMCSPSGHPNRPKPSKWAVIEDACEKFAAGVVKNVKKAVACVKNPNGKKTSSGRDFPWADDEGYEFTQIGRTAKVMYGGRP